MGNQVAVRLGGEWKTDAKVLVANLVPGDAFRLPSGGGGGCESPLERRVEDVANDVKQGYVSIEAAARLYGVVVDPVSFDVDRASTERRRAACWSAEPR